MLRFGEVFEAEEIVYALSRQLSWTHLRSLIYIDDLLKREFYLEMGRDEGWSTRILQGRLDSMLFERTALSRKPDELLTSELATLRDQGVLGPNLVLKDPYVLDFLGRFCRVVDQTAGFSRNGTAPLKLDGPFLAAQKIGILSH